MSRRRCVFAAAVAVFALRGRGGGGGGVLCRLPAGSRTDVCICSDQYTALLAITQVCESGDRKQISSSRSSLLFDCLPKRKKIKHIFAVEGLFESSALYPVKNTPPSSFSPNHKSCVERASWSTNHTPSNSHSPPQQTVCPLPFSSPSRSRTRICAPAPKPGLFKEH